MSIAPTQDNTQDDQEVTDSEDNFSFSSLLGQHTAQFTGNGTPPINTPIISQIKKSVCQSIWSNKYVELRLLLPNSINSSTNQAFTLQMDNNSKKLVFFGRLLIKDCSVDGLEVARDACSLEENWHVAAVWLPLQ